MSDSLIKIYGSTKYLPLNTHRNRKGEYHLCKTCGLEFYISQTYIKKAIQRGHDILYCSMKCYDKTGDKNPFWGKTFSEESLNKLLNNKNRPKFKAGKENPNFTRFGENSNYIGCSKQWWAKKLLNEGCKCEKCGYKDKRALCIHHIDKNPNNNTKDNLLLVCWNCHAIIHFEDKSGLYNHLVSDEINRGNNIKNNEKIN